MENHPITGSLKLKTIDCRDLPAPEPLMRVLEAVAQLQQDEAVVMLHRQKPCLLFPKLDERGLDYQMAEFQDGSVKILIWKKGSCKPVI